ncbi:MAG TPA: Hsp33 family molecular chaperone HslO [Terrimicrobiaceae bacterium]
MVDSKDSADPGIEVRIYFARGRNALVARAEFSELYAAMYLHRLDCGSGLESGTEKLLRDGLAAITLHTACRPWKETVAWTVNFQSPLANIFVSANNRLGTVIGNVFTENVKNAPCGLFYADIVSESSPPRRSVVEFSGEEFFSAVETLYLQSEQRLARFFRYDEEDVVLVTAQPDVDLEWLRSLDKDAIRRLDKDVELGLLEMRTYRFECGCNQDQMLDMLAPVMRNQSEDLFQGEEVIRIHCPRCGARHTITRESLEAHLARLID